MRTLIVLFFAIVGLSAWADEAPEIVAIADIGRGGAGSGRGGDSDAGLLVSFRGSVEAIDSYDRIVVADASGRTEVYAEEGFRRTAFKLGDVITVTGYADAGRLSLRNRVAAEEIILADGSSYLINDPIFLYCDEGM